MREGGDTSGITSKYIPVLHQITTSQDGSVERSADADSHKSERLLSHPRRNHPCIGFSLPPEGPDSGPGLKFELQYFKPHFFKKVGVRDSLQEAFLSLIHLVVTRI